MLTVGARLETVLLLERLGFCSKGAKSIFGEVQNEKIEKVILSYSPF